MPAREKGAERSSFRSSLSAQSRAILRASQMEAAA